MDPIIQSLTTTALTELGRAMYRQARDLVARRRPGDASADATLPSDGQALAEIERLAEIIEPLAISDQVQPSAVQIEAIDVLTELLPAIGEPLPDAATKIIGDRGTVNVTLRVVLGRAIAVRSPTGDLPTSAEVHMNADIVGVSGEVIGLDMTEPPGGQ